MPKRVLFIDDELELWEDALREELLRFDFDVKGEKDPEKALKCIASYRPDVVLLDILFPGGHLGKPTLGKIKTKYPSLPVVMITSTMDKIDFNPEEYSEADFRYAKLALADGDYSDLARVLDEVIEKYKLYDSSQKKLTAGDSELSRYGFIVGSSPVMKVIAEKLEKIAQNDLSVLITGESGTGKELIARAIHKLSRRREYPFVTVVCAAMPRELLESELFGHEKGAYTGAQAAKAGKFEAADEGTIFLDEIAEIPPDTQVKLLRFLQDKVFERVGGNQPITARARILAATNRDLKYEIANGSFREDLFYRLNVISINMPPLRERVEDIELLFKYFIEKANQVAGKRILPLLRDDVSKLFRSYNWPGNIRQMHNVILRAVALAEENILQSNNFADLTEIKDVDEQFIWDLSVMAEKIYIGTLGWNDVKKIYGSEGKMRRELLIAVKGRWEREHSKRIKAKQFAEILNTTDANMRRILSEYRIKLREKN